MAMTQEITRTPAMIAGEINLIKDQVRSTALSASVEIGKRLAEAKTMVPDGEWTRWLQENVDYSTRTAQNLMALAAEYAAGRGKTLDALSYTKAVMLLSLPAEEREEFAAEHDVEGMSSRELQKTISELKKQNSDMQLTMDQLIAEQKKSKADLDKTKAAVQQAKTVGQDAVESARALRAELKEAQEKAAAAEQKQKELESALKTAQGKTVVQQVTPPDVEKELAELRAKLSRSQDEQALRAGYEILKSSYTRLTHQLSELAARDAALAASFRGAFAKGLRLMADTMDKEGTS